MSKNTEPVVQPEVKEAANLKLDVSVRPIAPMDNLLGFANITINDCFVVEGFRICSGENGLYVNMPSQQDKNGNWRDMCKPITADFRRQITDAIVEGYGVAIEKLQATLEASRTAAAERPSVTGALKDNADKVKGQPTRSGGKNEQSL